MQDTLRPIGAADLEDSLQWVRAQAAGPAQGVFGPDSMLWRVDRESLVFLGAGRALLMQLAHPWVAAAIAEHSAVASDPIGRFHRTFEIVFTLVFGSLDQALSTARRLHRRHGAVTGAVPERLGPFPEGSPYLANEASALMWVHATLIDTALSAYELVLPPLGAEDRERYYSECRVLGALFGVPPEVQPANWTDFVRYMEETLRSDRLSVGSAAREIASAVLKGVGPFRAPRWYRAVTSTLLPEPLRGPFDLPLGEAERRRAAPALATIRRLHPASPAPVRFVAPYHEALARLSGRRRPDLVTRSFNRLWIGRSAMRTAGEPRLD